MGAFSPLIQNLISKATRNYFTLGERIGKRKQLEWTFVDQSFCPVKISAIKRFEWEKHLVRIDGFGIITIKAFLQWNQPIMFKVMYLTEKEVEMLHLPLEFLKKLRKSFGIHLSYQKPETLYGGLCIIPWRYGKTLWKRRYQLKSFIQCVINQVNPSNTYFLNI